MDGESTARETRSALRRLQHDLRTPLNAIVGYGEMLEEDLRERGLDDLLPDLEHIARAATALLHVIDGAGPPGPSDDEADGATEAMSNPQPDAARILVVDDEAENRTLVSQRLGREGYEVTEATNGADALRLIAAETVDVVLLDHMMPEMNGLETLDRIRATASVSDLPVIMATALAGRDDIVAALRHGANDYVTKPLDFPVVLARIRTQLALRSANREIESLAGQLEARNAFLRKTFGRYLSTDIAATLLERDDGLEIAGERRRVTALMADLRGFTTLTEQIDPRDVVAILNDHLGAMSEVIEEHLGTIDEYIGDGILALFGAFETRPDDAQRAVVCALAMQHALDSVNERGRARGLPTIAMGVGIATGDVVVGSIGSERRSKFTAIGSCVNLSARLESFAKGGETLISPNTYDEVRALVEIDETRSVEPKGFNSVVLARRVTSIRATDPK